MKNIRRGISKKLLCLALALCSLLVAFGGALLEAMTGTLAAPESASADSISGSLWLEEGEQPLAGYPVYLYKADGPGGPTQPEESDPSTPEAPAPGDSFDFASPFAHTLTGADGSYLFANLAPDHYVVGIALGGAESPENSAQVVGVSAFTAGESLGGAPMAFSDIVEITEGAAITEINAGVRLALAPRAGNSYEIDSNYNAGSLTLTGRGYSFDPYATGQNAGMLIFNTAANGNVYKIIRTGTGAGLIRGIAFPAGVNPVSVTINDLSLSKGITFSNDFTADLTFNNVELSVALVLPADCGTLGINGLATTALTLPANYRAPLTFNGLTVTDTNGLKYPAGYNLPITIGGTFDVKVDVKGSQFPEDYSGLITIGDSGGEFTNQQTICRPGAGIGFDSGIFLPGNISTLTINNAKTGGTGALNIKLGAEDKFELLLSGDSSIKGHIEVPPNAALTIDSAAATGSEDGRLAITSSGVYACIGTANDGDTGQITIQGGTVEATQTIGDAQHDHPAAIGGGAGRTGNVTSTGGKVIAKGNLNGAAIGGGVGANGVGNVTITGGTVNATAGDNGAGIGGGSGATGGFAPNATGANVLITGGTVTATGGDLHNILQGSTNAYGAGIGGGNNGFANVTITGGHVTANSGHGAGIGSGAGGTFGFPGSGEQKGSIEITGGIIRGYTQNGANIGQGFARGYLPTYRIDKEADILMYTRGSLDDAPGVQCAGSNGGDGYFVSVHNFEVLIRGDVYVYGIDANGKTSALDRVLPIPQDKVYYMTFLFSTGHDYPEQFHIFTDYYDPDGVNKGMQQYVHHYDHLPPLPGPSGGSSTHQL
ncbi:MAG: hypothetical protein LBB75_03090, partial [Oscillospiraceae bacterium]|nr:hypothetical protein [Oscillospiraceae bacterium]